MLLIFQKKKKTVLDRNNVSLNNYIAQRYDGTAVSNGHLDGVQNNINPFATGYFPFNKAQKTGFL